MNATKDDMVMACLGEGVGEVRVDLYAKNQTRIIAAHNNAIQQLCLNLSGNPPLLFFLSLVNLNR